MSSRLEVGQKVRLKISRWKEDKNNQVYETKVVDLGDNIIELDFSFVQGGKPTGIRRGKRLTLVFIGRNGLYKQPVEVKQFKRDPILSLEVIRDGKWKKVQRRRYVRVPVGEDVEYRIDNGEFKQGLMVDVSGGGIKLKIDDLEGLEEEDKLDLKLLPLSLSQSIIKGKVVRIRKDEDSDTGETNYNLGIQFVGLSDEVREEIIEWGFVKHRELRRKGLI